jgi:dsRNA-specific ribonuclease
MLKDATHHVIEDFKGELNRLASQQFKTHANILSYITEDIPSHPPMFRSTVTLSLLNISFVGEPMNTKKKSQQSAARKAVQAWNEMQFSKPSTP